MWSVRPYDPAFAARIVDLAEADGLSRAELAKALGASERDLDAWAAAQPAFAVALADADTLARAWWEAAPRRALQSGEAFRVGIWAKAMAQRYGRSCHPPREKAPPVRQRRKVRFNIPDNGRDRPESAVD
jgi:hypothetical protein